MLRAVNESSWLRLGAQLRDTGSAGEPRRLDHDRRRRRDGAVAAELALALKVDTRAVTVSLSDAPTSAGATV